MSANILMGEGGDPAAHARLQALAADPRVARILDTGFDARREDPTVHRLMGEFQEAERAVLMGLAPGAVHIPTGLPNQLTAYKNRELIADGAMPVVAVAKKSNDIWELPATTLQQIANTAITGGRARPNEVPYDVNHDKRYNCKDYGLVDWIGNDTTENADAPLDPRMTSAMVVKSFLDLAREYRVAGQVFNSGNYGSNVSTLSGSARWDNSASDPVAAMQAAKEAVFSTPNVLVLGGQVWAKLKTHPKVLQYILSRTNAANIGTVPAQVQLDTLAALIEVDRVIVGRAKYLSTQEGSAAPTSAYIWGKSAALIRVEPNPNPRMTSTFGYTYRWGSKAYRNMVIPEQLPGLMGGEYLKLTHSDDEVVIGGETTGFFFDTVIS